MSFTVKLFACFYALAFSSILAVGWLVLRNSAYLALKVRVNVSIADL